MCFVSPHNHTSRSNFRLLDCTNSVEDLIKTSAQMGYKGIAITDHETVSAHVEALKVTEELKKKEKIPQDFKLILGNEIYLVDTLESVRDEYKSGVTKFPHFILLAKDKKGHEQLRYLSSKAWSNSFHTGLMERTPTEKEVLKQVVDGDKGHLIATTACLGSESSIYLLKIKEAIEKDNKEEERYFKKKLKEFFSYCISVFGKEDFYIELQPALSEEQIYVNEKLISLSEYYDLKCIISTDTHYLRPEDRVVHRSFLNSKEGDREVDSFYEACFLQTVEEMKDRMDYIDEKIINDSLSNTLLLADKVEEYTILNEPVIPKINLPEFELRHLFKKAYGKYTYIEKMANSEDEQNRYLVKLIEDGFMEKLNSSTLSTEYFHEILNRLDLELGELYEISKSLNQAMSAYYVTVREIINIIWDDECGGNSLVGSGRGSASGFLLNYLLGITQINPLIYGVELPHWRHLHHSRPDIADIDIDTEGSKRPQILSALKRHFGEDRVLQVCTYGTEGSKSALQTACRGLGIDTDIAQYISGLIPFERGSNWSIADCLYGNEKEERKPIKEFINEIEKHENLKEVALKIEGTVNKRSIHAGGVIIYNDPYYKSNAMMTAPNGTHITQFNLGDSESVGNIKYDLLTVECLDKIRETLDLLVKYDEIEWKGNIRKTFDHYLHPDTLDFNNQEMYDLIGSGKVMDLFQFSTEIGQQTIKKIKPTTLIETASASSLMRLMSEGEEQPIDTFVKYKNNIDFWYEELGRYNLNEYEIKVLEGHLLQFNGVAETQESAMLLSMDENIAGFDVKWANKLRKAIAKKNKDALEEVHTKFYEQGEKLGNRKEILDYVWNVQMKRQEGYSFSELHTIAYSIIGLQEIKLNLDYPPLYWQTSCLTVNSGGQENTSEDDKKKSKTTDYGKIAQAIGNVRKNGVKIALPDINNAQFGFTPDKENNQIIFGLKGMNGIGDDVVDLIIENRPYSSVNDFISRMCDTKLIQTNKMLQLIKGGCFDSFGDRKMIMGEYLKHTFEFKKKLTTANIPMIEQLGLIPKEHSLRLRFYNFKKHISKKVYKTISKPKDRLLKLDEVSKQFYETYFTDKAVDGVVNGKLVISENVFKKEFDKKIEPLKEWLSLPETLEMVNQELFEESYYELMNEPLGKWEMDSLSYYYNEHELSHVNMNKYGIINFDEVPVNPIIEDVYTVKGVDRYIYQLDRICGTVLDKDKNKNLITLLTPTGVVTVKFYGGAYNFYDRQLSQINSDGSKTITDRSWFKRGNKLMITGFRRGERFFPRKYKNSIYQHTVQKINHIDEEGNLSLTSERE